MRNESLTGLVVTLALFAACQFVINLLLIRRVERLEGKS